MVNARAGCWVLVLLTAGCEVGPEPPQRPTAADGAPTRALATPASYVKVRVGDRRVLFEGPAVTPKCFGGHKGFVASAGADRLHLNTFIFEPGRYTCGEPSPYVFLEWKGEESSAEYQISPAMGPGGWCELVVESVAPRMRAVFRARLPRTSPEGPEQVELTEGQLDVAMPVNFCP